MGQFLPARLTRQPQQRPQIDWSNPITKGLVFCAPGIGGNYDDIVGKKKATATAITRKANPDGVFSAFGGASIIDYPAFGPELPVGGSATIAWIDQPVGLSGYGTTFDFMPSGGASEILIYQGPSPYGLVAGPRGAGFIPEFTATVGVPTEGALRRLMVRCSTNLSSAAVADWAVFVGGLKCTTTTTSGISGGAASANRWGALPGGSDFWEGVIGQKCIWNRALTDAEARSYQSNPWQLFKNPQRRLLVDATGAGPVNATGTLASTLGDATIAASGAVLNAGAFASTLANATMVASGAVGSAPSGILASTLADATMSAAGAATNAGSFATSLAGASMSAAGIVINRGTLSATMGNATMTAAGTVAPNATGTFSSTLDGATMAAYGYNGVPPVLAGFFHRLPKNPRHVQRIP